MTSDIVISDIIYDSNFWDSKHYIISFSSHPGYLKTDAKVLASFVLYIVYFIQKYANESCPIEQLSSIIEVGFLM